METRARDAREVPGWLRRAERDGGPVRFFGAVPRGACTVVLVALMTAACRGDLGIERPTALFTASPVEYPLELWDQDVEGSTLVRVLVNEEGSVDSVMVVESSGHVALDSAAVRGAMAMEFDPARKRGEPLRVWARVPVHFSKDGRPPMDDGPRGEPDVTSGLPEGGPA
ncbi:MAG: energy transducer TonB [Gemmatimonadetes bacterium]|nr:energy transducer TonB [Gemmatimonadota bacterium]